MYIPRRNFFKEIVGSGLARRGTGGNDGGMGGRKPVLIGIAGPSGSGKTLLAGRLAGRLGGAVVLPLDAYYRDLSHLAPTDREKVNFDDPRAVDRERLEADLLHLSQGRRIVRPDYDFHTHTRRPAGIPLSPGPFVLAEGLFALFWESVRRLWTVPVYIDVTEEMALARRIARDTSERGRSRESVLGQFRGSVLPMWREHIAPTRRFARVVLSGEAPPADQVSAVLQELKV
jgi:uridine kinase